MLATITVRYSQVKDKLLMYGYFQSLVAADRIRLLMDVVPFTFLRFCLILSFRVPSPGPPNACFALIRLFSDGLIGWPLLPSGYSLPDGSFEWLGRVSSDLSPRLPLCLSSRSKSSSSWMASWCLPLLLLSPGLYSIDSLRRRPGDFSCKFVPIAVDESWFSLWSPISCGSVPFLPSRPRRCPPNAPLDPLA